MKNFIFLLFLFLISLGASAQGIQITEICLPSSTGCVPVNNNTPFPISTNVPAAVPTINASQVIAVGGTFQVALPINPLRKSLTVINNNTNNHTCYLFIGGAGIASTANSIVLPPNAQYFRNSGYIPQDVIQVTCSNSADTLYVDYE